MGLLDGGDDLDSTDTTSLFNWTSDRLTMDNWTVGDFMKTGIGMLIVSIYVGIVDVFQAIVGFFTTPLTSAGNAVGDLYQALVSGPTVIIVEGAQQTADSIATELTGMLGIAALPVGVAMVLASLWIVVKYLSEEDTSDIFPGSFTDIDMPSWIPFIGDPGVQEEGEDEDRD